MSRRKDAQGFTGASLTARTANQKHFIKEIIAHCITLAYGPPGTGKTHVAVGMAAEMLRKNQIEKIVICRPVVPSGRDIGYLPGSMEEKLAPWLQPLYDELSYYIDRRFIKQWMEQGTIEIVPLAMMRGRTFRDSFVILDEAQNATFDELKMFLTRIGEGTKMVAVGDLNQSDLPRVDAGQYEDVIDLLEGVDQLSIVELDRTDIVRHPMIGELEKRLNSIH
jgi:phosphate starvation-inducible PhoH-like protein